MENNKTENLLNEEISGPVTLIYKYPKIEFGLLFHPGTTFRELARNKTTQGKIGPGAFLFINILLACVIGRLIGYEMPKLPWEIPWFSGKWLGDFSSFTIRYIIGLGIFLVLLDYFNRRIKVVQSVSNAFQIICYSSAIFMFIVILQRVKMYFLSSLFLNSISFFSHASSNFGAVNFAIAAISFLITLVMVFWWLSMVYKGFCVTKIASIKSLRKLLALSYLGFLALQFLFSGLISFFGNYDTMQVAIIISDKKVEKAVSENPPNYWKAWFLACQVGSEQSMMPYVRYKYKIKSIVYKIAALRHSTPEYTIDAFKEKPVYGHYMALNNDTSLDSDQKQNQESLDYMQQIIETTLKNIEQNNYGEAEKYLSSRLDDPMFARTYQMQLWYKDLKRDLKEVEEIRILPDYAEGQEHGNFNLGVPFFRGPMALFP